MILTQQSTKILGIIASIIAVVVGIMLVILPAYNQWTENNDSISQAETEVGLMQSQRDGFLQAQTLYPQLQEIDSSLRIRFPEIADNDGIISQLAAALASSGIPSSSLALTFSPPEIMTPVFTEEELPAEPAPADDTAQASEDVAAEAPATEAPASGLNDMAKMSVSITVSGTDPQITQFLNVLHSADRAIVVKQFSVQKNEETGIGQLALTSEVYIFARIPNPGDVSQADEGQEEYVSDEFGGETTE